MNDFDRYLETELKLMLDPVVGRRPPTRRGLSDEAKPPVVVPLLGEALAAEAIPVPAVEPVILPVAPASSL